MTRLLTLEANSGVVASPMCTVNIHWSRATLRGLGDQILCRSSQKHFTCQNKDSSKFCGRWSGYVAACHTSVHFYEGLVCFLVLKHSPSSFIPSLQISEVWSAISKQCNLILECWVKSLSEFDHNGLIIVILHKVYELLESVNGKIDQGRLFQMLPNFRSSVLCPCFRTEVPCS